jgi:hypothetical protein
MIIEIPLIICCCFNVLLFLLLFVFLFLWVSVEAICIGFCCYCCFCFHHERGKFVSIIKIKNTVYIIFNQILNLILGSNVYRESIFYFSNTVQIACTHTFIRRRIAPTRRSLLKIYSVQ